VSGVSFAQTKTKQKKCLGFVFLAQMIFEDEI
jgi:hypothetical protein